MIKDLSSQLMEQKMKVDFNSYDISIKELISMVSDDLIDIAPEYQRQFRWDTERQSSLIESFFLGIPVPSIFMATNADGTWELIDGVQRVTCCLAGNPHCWQAGQIGGLSAITIIVFTEFLQNVFKSVPTWDTKKGGHSHGTPPLGSVEMARICRFHHRKGKRLVFSRKQAFFAYPLVEISGIEPLTS